MSTDISSLKAVLSQHGYHSTKAREATFNLLLSPEPQTMNQVLQKAHGQVDRVSVYRNVDLFEKLGIVKRIYTGWKYKLELTDAFLPHHHHLNCSNCGMTIDIEDEDHIDSFIEQVAAKFGFTPVSHQFEIEGYCKRCSETV